MSDKASQAGKTLLAIVIGLVGCAKKETITASALAPGGTSRVLMIEKDDGRMDRNFDIFLENGSAAPQSRKLLFSSPDEGRPPGTERFIWSKDGQHVLLLGKQFSTKGAVTIESGESLYLLYNVKSGQLRCNANQQRTYDSFSKADVEAIPWAGSLSPR